MELYLIRHGQSTNNRGDARVPDPPLTELGRQQADRAGRALRNLGITRLYCSAMLRAVQTAAIVGARLELAPHVFVGIHEWGGIWKDRIEGGVEQLPGLTRSQLRDVCPSVVLPDDVTDAGWWFPSSNSDEPTQEWNHTQILRSIHENCLAFIAHLDQYHDEEDERVGAIIHGGAGSILLGTILGMQQQLPPPDDPLDRFPHNNTGITKVRRSPERSQILFHNQTAHLLDDGDYRLETDSPMIT